MLFLLVGYDTYVFMESEYICTNMTSYPNTYICVLNFINMYLKFATIIY